MRRVEPMAILEDDGIFAPGIHYDGSLRVFRLRCKSSMYAFRIDDQRNLEHLYWGPALPSSDDITFLTRARVPGPFDLRGVATVAQALGMDELKMIGQSSQSLSEAWRVFTREKGNIREDVAVRLKARRLENTSWRLWYMDLRGQRLNREFSEVAVHKARKMHLDSMATFLENRQRPQFPQDVGELITNGQHVSGSDSPVSSSARSSSNTSPSASIYLPDDMGSSPSDKDLNAHMTVSDFRVSASDQATPKSMQAVLTSVPLKGQNAHGKQSAGSPRSNQFMSRQQELNTSSAMSAGIGLEPAPLPPLPLADTSDAESKNSVLPCLDLQGHRGGRERFEEQLKLKIHVEVASKQKANKIDDGFVLDKQEPLPNLRTQSGDIPQRAGTKNKLTGASVSFKHCLTQSHGLEIDARERDSNDDHKSRTSMTSKRSNVATQNVLPPKKNFAAIEAMAGINSADAILDLNETKSTTNWEKLDPDVAGKSCKLLEYSDSGSGDFREPSFKLHYSKDGSFISPLEYTSYKIIRGKSSMPENMPALYTETPSEATTLVIEMVDRLTKFKVHLYYTVYHDYDIIARRAVLENDSDQAVCLNQAMSATVDFDAESVFYMTQLSGGWARERQVITRKLDEGLTVVRSTRGSSSHQFNPFLVITADREPNEKFGDCYAFCLVYSGNFQGSAEVTEHNRLRVNMGVNAENFSWHLEPAKNGTPGGRFYTPEIVLAYSNCGMGGTSRQLHRIFRERLMPPKWRYKIPPVLLNTWEAAYFDVTHDLVVEIARKAAKAKIELLVLDDGWFGSRNDTYSGLGDWTPNPKKLPKGLNGLAEDVNALGLKFGVWIEPEMVSMNSDLYRQHPDWCLHVPSRSRTIGRNQLVLDFSRKCVRDNIYCQLEALLRGANIEYVKWDMNRNLTEVFSQDWEPSRQGEIAHRYILGVYEVFGKITRAFPHVLFESCSGGGGRFDAGMLYFTSQIWTSDNTDALSRARIQYGTSLAYPASAMGSHVSNVPNHQTMRTTSVKTRSLLAMSGTFGYELDPRDMTEKDVNEVLSYIRLQKRVAPLVYQGDMYRLWSPFEHPSMAWMFVSQDKRRAVVIATNIFRAVGKLDPRLRLDGLLSTAIYSVEELCPGTMLRNLDTGAIEYEPRGVYQYGKILKLSGLALCKAGLPINFLFDADSVIFELNQIGSLTPSLY